MIEDKRPCCVLKEAIDHFTRIKDIGRIKPHVSQPDGLDQNSGHVDVVNPEKRDGQ